MKKILGLDLGITSIGWALVNEAEEDNENSSIIKLGVRVIPLTIDEQTNFEKGKSITTNADRTLKRSMRRNLQRYKLRRENLIELLKKNRLISDENLLGENGNATTFQTYRLRAKAATEEISLEEFSRVLLMINKKRGYKSSRKVKSEDEGQLIDGMTVAKQLYEEQLTPGQFVNHLFKTGKNYVPDFYRSDLRNEFDKVFDAQKAYYPLILTNELKEMLRDKKRDAVWGICSKHFNDNGIELIGIKRQGKLQDQKREDYEWRAKALTEKLDLEQVVIIIQQINSQINASSGYLGAIGDRSKELYFGNLTVGQYQMMKLDKDPNYSLRNQVFYRQDYLDEFERVWETQAKYHKELTPELKHEIRDICIFYQRRLKSQKGSIAVCELEGKQMEVEIDGKKKQKLVGPKVCPKSSLLFQEFKIWQVLNNLTVNKQFLDQSSKEKLFAELSLREKMSKMEVLRLLYSNPQNLTLNYENVEGNTTWSSLFKAYQRIAEVSGHDISFSKKSAQESINTLAELFKALGINTKILSFDPELEGDAFEQQPSYRLWHLLYSYEGDNSKTGDEKLIAILSNQFGFAPEYAKIVAGVTFKDDYGSLSAKAIRKILPHMKAGNDYSVACEYAGYHSHSKRSLTKEELEEKVYKDKLELLPCNSLRNPVVEKILNQMINVVNSIISVYGKPDEIRIELARELKKSAKEREETTAAINSATKEQERIKELLKKEFGIEHVGKNDILRYRLYDELRFNGYKTLYSNTYIPREKLFSKEFDIEHIIPQARLFDDSFSNKTLETRSINIEKSNTTAFDFVKTKYGDNGENSIQNYKNRVELLYKNKIISKSKHEKLLMTLGEIPGGFIDRDLRDSQYIAKKAREILEGIVKFVVPTTGGITDRLREDWGLVDIMKELNWDKFNKLGLTESYQDKDGRTIRQIKRDVWTKRNDHRHHAMDALTIAFTRMAYVQYLNNLNARIGKSADQHIDLSNYNLSDINPEDRTAVIYAIENKFLSRNAKGQLLFIPPMPRDEFRAEAKRQLENIIVSQKAKNKVATIKVNKADNKATAIVVTKDGEKKTLKGQVVRTPRGQLHNETIYGKHKWYSTKEEKVGGTFNSEKIQMVANSKIRTALMQRLQSFGGDAKKAFTGKNSIDNNPIWLNDQHTDCVPQKVKLVWFDTVFTIRKMVSSDLKLDKVVDTSIRRVLQKRLDEYDGDAKKAFSNIEENPIWLNQKKGIKIKRVSITGVSNAVALHDKRDKYGNVMHDSDGNRIPVDYVSTSNNHHVAIYRDADGNLQEKVVSFYEAVTRKNQGIPVVDKNYNADKGWKFLFSMKQNEYFVLPNIETGFNPNEIDLMDPNNYCLISPNLFRVQKITTHQYMFRHHLETVVGERKELRRIAWEEIRTPAKLDGIVKVRVNHIGHIVSVGEY